MPLQWHRRLYAFLLRRILGPFLTKKSQSQLSQCIEVSFQDGRVLLRNIELDPDYVTRLLGKEGQQQKVCAKRVLAKRLEVCLSLTGGDYGGYGDDDDGEGGGGGNNAMGLLASVDIDGVEMDLVSFKGQRRRPLLAVGDERVDDAASKRSGGGGWMSSMIDAALSSLRLTVTLSEVKVRIFDGQERKYVAMSLDSLRYGDLSPSPSPSSSGSSSSSSTVLHKAVEFGCWKLSAGCCFTDGEVVGDDDKEMVLTESEGTGRVILRVVQCGGGIDVDETKDETILCSLRHDVEVSLHQRVNTCVNLESMSCLLAVIGEFCKDDDDDIAADVPQDVDDSSLDETGDMDFSSQQTAGRSNNNVDSIMRQYAEARHLARTNEVRGGILVPSCEDDVYVDACEGNGTTTIGDEPISFDAFFDCNSTSFSNYMSMMHSVRGDTGYSKKKSSGLNTCVKFHLLEAGLKVMFEEREYVLVSLSDVYATGVLSDEGLWNVDADIPHFEIEDSVFTSATTTENDNVGYQQANIGSLLRFVEDSTTEDSYIVAAPPCISISINQTAIDLSPSSSSSSETSTNIEIRLQGMEIIPRLRTLTSISQFSANLPTNKSQFSNDTTQTNSKTTSISTKITCSSPKLSLLLPLDQHKVSPSALSALFSRHTHLTYDGLCNFPSLGISLTPLYLDMLQDNETSLVTHSMTLFVSSPQQQHDGVASSSPLLVRELGSMSGEPSISPESVIKINSTSKINFPILPPLRSVKLRQETTTTEKKGIDCGGGGGGVVVRGDDPQEKLMKQAEQCELVWEVNIPYSCIDLTVGERMALIEFLECPKQQQQPNEVKPVDDTAAAAAADSNPKDKQAKRWGIAVTCEQIVMLLHDSDGEAEQQQANKTNDATKGKKDHSFVLISDGLKTFSTFNPEEGSCQSSRLFARDIILYEGQFNPGKNDGRCRWNANKMKMRGCSFIKNAIPVFHRSNLSYPLSPETPSLHLDAVRDEGDDMGKDDWEVRLCLYDMTYRYNLESEWFKRFLAVLKGRYHDNETTTISSVDNNKNDNADCDDKDEEEDDDDDEETALTRIFITFSDCTLDYTPPRHFQRHSRVMMRFGEIHISSNILVPTASLQAYKASIADVALHICNKRFPYTLENAQLPLARTLLRFRQTNDVLLDDYLENANKSLEEVLDVMNFVNVGTLDSVDLYLKANHSDISNDHPFLAISLTTGLLSGFFCKDSFACLTDTYGEWSLVFMAISEEEKELLRQKEQNREQQQQQQQQHLQEKDIPIEGSSSSAPPPTETADDDMSEESTNESFPHDDHQLQETDRRPYANVPDSELSASELRHKHSYKKDDVASNLAKSLLIQNYYTLDTTTTSSSESLERLSSYSRLETESLFGPLLKFEEDDDDDGHYCGEDWTSVEKTQDDDVEDQRAKWFVDNDNTKTSDDDDDDIDTSLSSSQPLQQPQPPPLQIFPQHVPLSQTRDEFWERGDLGATNLAKIGRAPDVNVRLILKDLAVNCRFFDGRDWDVPLINKKQMKNSKKSRLLSELLCSEDNNDADDCNDNDYDADFFLPPLACSLKKNRKDNKFFQLSFKGMRLRTDIFAETNHHQLASCMKMTLMDLYLAETISGKKPKKMLGEWVNDIKHPRDSYDGMLMMKMASFHPTSQFTPEGKLKADEGSVVIDLLPLRCHIDQIAMRFVRNFFSSDEKKSNSETNNNNAPSNNDSPPQNEDDNILTFFKQFKVNPCKLKVNYHPVEMDVKALREGSYSEILNLFSLEGMELVLQTVLVRDVVGWGDAISEMLSTWIEDICQTQMHKFLTGAAPFHSISAIGGEIIDFVCIPVHHYKHKNDPTRTESLGKRMRKGTSSFAGTIALETLNTTSKITELTARVLDKASPMATKLPPRPDKIPMNMTDTAEHVYESLLRGVRTSHYTVVVVPKRVYETNGTTGAISSVVKGVPVAVLAPLSGASEALSYALLGMRNYVRPDVRKEEEADLRDLF